MITVLSSKSVANNGLISILLVTILSPPCPAVEESSVGVCMSGWFVIPEGVPTILSNPYSLSNDLVAASVKSLNKPLNPDGFCSCCWSPDCAP